jgi:hypothetical protein
MISTLRAPVHVPLLGILASQNWFTKMGEQSTTRAVAALLQHPELAEPFLDWVRTTMQIDLPEDIVAFVPEAIDSTGKRPDIVGLDAQGRPRLIVELKFEAKIDINQVAAYRREQIRHFGSDRHESATLLVVPVKRLTKAADALGRIASLLPQAVREDLDPDRHLAGPGRGRAHRLSHG